ncbi:MAG: hypothetical protein WCJ13_10545 [Coriobacteriia bacterium]
MEYCGKCGTPILSGAKVADGVSYCCQRHLEQDTVRRDLMAAVPPDEVQRLATEYRNGCCPECGGAGPVDVYLAIDGGGIITRKRFLACKDCSDRKLRSAQRSTYMFGFLRLPTMISSPSVLSHNRAEMQRFDTGAVSPQLLAYAREELASELGAGSDNT